MATTDDITKDKDLIRLASDRARAKEQQPLPKQPGRSNVNPSIWHKGFSRGLRNGDQISSWRQDPSIFNCGARTCLRTPHPSEQVLLFQYCHTSFGTIPCSESFWSFSASPCFSMCRLCSSNCIHPPAVLRPDPATFKSQANGSWANTWHFLFSAHCAHQARIRGAFLHDDGPGLEFVQFYARWCHTSWCHFLVMFFLSSKIGWAWLVPTSSLKTRAGVWKTNKACCSVSPKELTEKLLSCMERACHLAVTGMGMQAHLLWRMQVVHACGCVHERPTTGKNISA